MQLDNRRGDWLQINTAKYCESCENVCKRGDKQSQGKDNQQAWSFEVACGPGLEF